MSNFFSKYNSGSIIGRASYKSGSFKTQAYTYKTSLISLDSYGKNVQHNNRKPQRFLQKIKKYIH